MTGKLNCRFGSPCASDSPALIQAYLEKYPNGEFSALARIRVDELTPDGR
jgi:hypothetical protein